MFEFFSRLLGELLRIFLSIFRKQESKNGADQRPRPASDQRELLEWRDNILSFLFGDEKKLDPELKSRWEKASSEVENKKVLSFEELANLHHLRQLRDNAILNDLDGQQSLESQPVNRVQAYRRILAEDKDGSQLDAAVTDVLRQDKQAATTTNKKMKEIVQEALSTYNAMGISALIHFANSKRAVTQYVEMLEGERIKLPNNREMFLDDRGRVTLLTTGKEIGKGSFKTVYSSDLVNIGRRDDDKLKLGSKSEPVVTVTMQKDQNGYVSERTQAMFQGHTKMLKQYPDDFRSIMKHMGKSVSEIKDEESNESQRLLKTLCNADAMVDVFKKLRQYEASGVFNRDMKIENMTVANQHDEENPRVQIIDESFEEHFYTPILTFFQCPDSRIMRYDSILNHIFSMPGVNMSRVIETLLHPEKLRIPFASYDQAYAILVSGIEVRKAILEKGEEAKLVSGLNDVQEQLDKMQTKLLAFVEAYSQHVLDRRPYFRKTFCNRMQEAFGNKAMERFFAAEVFGLPENYYEKIIHEEQTIDIRKGIEESKARNARLENATPPKKNAAATVIQKIQRGHAIRAKQVVAFKARRADSAGVDATDTGPSVKGSGQGKQMH